jgi:hypothetical protein
MFIEFDSRGLDFLEFLSQPRSVSTDGSITEDWYGIERDSSEPETELRVVLVHDDTAYLPISISSLLLEVAQSGQQSYSALAAYDLSAAEVNTLSIALQ